MVLTSWLPVQNRGIRRAGGAQITAAQLTAGILPEAMDVNLFWDEALETVLTDHDWAFAKKSLLLGTSTTTETPVTPVGVPELTSANTVRKYYMPVPDYDITAILAGTVNFEIVRVLENSYVSEWVPEQNRIYFHQAITGVNVYVTVILKPGYATAGRDTLFCRALELALALLISRPVAGKDNPRDVMNQAKYDKAIAEARYRDNTAGDPAQDGSRFWFDAANPSVSTVIPWMDSSGRWHSEG